MIDVGLEYLTLSRSTKSLSGGEAQRVRLATQVGSQLVGVLYILDEPSIGLHQKDNIKLIDSLKKHNLKVDKIDGMKFNMIKDEWSISADKSVNYIGRFIKI